MRGLRRRVQGGLQDGVGFRLVQLENRLSTGLGGEVPRMGMLGPEFVTGGQNLVQGGAVSEEGAGWRWRRGYDGVVLEGRRRLG